MNTWNSQKDYEKHNPSILICNNHLAAFCGDVCDVETPIFIWKNPNINQDNNCSICPKPALFLVATIDDD